MIGSDMRQDTMFGKDVDHKQFSQVIQSDGVYCWNKYGLFGELLNDNQNCVEVG